MSKAIIHFRNLATVCATLLPKLLSGELRVASVEEEVSA